MNVDQNERDLASIRLPRWGRVAPSDGVVPWLLLDDERRPVDPVRSFLTDLVARDASASSVRSYAYVLLRWWRWLRVVEVPWNRASSAEVRDLALWLSQATKRPREDGSRPRARSVNPITGKPQGRSAYQPRTVRHNNAVLRSFYDFCLDRGDGPIINPVRLDRVRHTRPGEYGSLETSRPVGRIRYNPKVPKQRPREIPDQHWTGLFRALTSNRDRAILSTTVSNGARASEILGVRCIDLDWGDQRIRVVRKGTRVEQWLPASSEAFVWIRLYLADLGTPLDLQDPLWWTLRRRPRADDRSRRPLNYEALRAVFRRVNRLLGTNWSMHDLRHTAALRMSRDDALSLRDVQTILGHAHATTTADVYLVEQESQVIRRVQRHLARPKPPTVSPQTGPEAAYDSDDLQVLFSGRLP